MIEYKNVVIKQSDASFYPSPPYVLSAALTSIPLTMVESIIMSLLVYFMSTFALEAGRWFFLVFTLILTSLALNSFYRVICFSVPSQEIAISIANPVTGILIIVCGFFITRHKIPDWLIWGYWCNPFTWSLTSLALNEFHAPAYSAAENDGHDQGEAFLGVFEIPSADGYRWGGVAFLAGFFVLCSAAAAVHLYRNRATAYTQGARRLERLDDDADIVGDDGGDTAVATVRVKVQEQDVGETFPFERATLVWSNIGYAVEVEVDAPVEQGAAPGADATNGKEQATKAKKIKKQRQLLTDINGFARPGEVTALMGASGAGKVISQLLH
jgi:ABC-type multidrug transport system fused ATPase/permease subunit